MTNSQEEKVYEQMLAMLADQFYHQPGANITINRAALADMLTKQTMHGIELGAAAERERIAKVVSELRLQEGKYVNAVFKSGYVRCREHVVRLLTPTNTV